MIDALGAVQNVLLVGGTFAKFVGKAFVFRMTM